MPDQADQLRRIVRETFKQQRSAEEGVPLVVVSGGGVGMGTTTVALGLSSELARLGKRTVLVDANPLNPGIANRLSLTTSESLREVLAGTRSAVEVIQHVSDRLGVLPGRRSASEPPDMRSEAIERLFADMQSLHGQADIVVLDVGSGTSPWVERHWQAADQILLVTTAEPQGVQDSYAALKLICGEHFGGNAKPQAAAACGLASITEKIHLVVNQCRDTQLGQRIAERFTQTSSYFLGTPMQSTSTLCASAEDEPAHQRSLRMLAADIIGNSCHSPASFAA